MQFSGNSGNGFGTTTAAPPTSICTQMTMGGGAGAHGNVPKRAPWDPEEVEAGCGPGDLLQSSLSPPWALDRHDAGFSPGDTCQSSGSQRSPLGTGIASPLTSTVAGYAPSSANGHVGRDATSNVFGAVLQSFRSMAATLGSTFHFITRCRRRAARFQSTKSYHAV
mmetsp:Transcript_137103/g.273450  ORF Transcript_137103/g.273450 Transcript_137103/m.273450 type:complete len:166 (+) Transcript_137103:116-613(+)